MGNAISFRLNPKNESDKRILDWLEEKSSQPGFFNLTEVIKKAILTAIEDEQKENQEKSIEDWISEAILLSREEFTKIVKESSQTVANNVFAGVLGAMAQQVNMGAVPMSQMTGMVQNRVPVNGSIHVTDVEALYNESYQTKRTLLHIRLFSHTSNHCVRQFIIHLYEFAAQSSSISNRLPSMLFVELSIFADVSAASSLSKASTSVT